MYVKPQPNWFGATVFKFSISPLVRKYDLDESTKTITDYIDQCEDSDWMEIAQKLSRVFAWEYEDYQPYLS